MENLAVTESEIQRGCAGLVQREVYCCASYLISTFAQGYGRGFNGGHGDLPAVCEQAAELCFPIEDWEEAASQEGYRVSPVSDDGTIDAPVYGGFCWGKDRIDDEETYDTEEKAWRACCDENSIDPYEREVFEHWIVSEWLGRKLQERGEKVDFDFCNLVIWARTTTGQSISMDHVIREIYKSTQKGVVA